MRSQEKLILFGIKVVGCGSIAHLVSLLVVLYSRLEVLIPAGNGHLFEVVYCKEMRGPWVEMKYSFAEKVVIFCQINAVYTAHA